jgi:hypothetical protein
MGFSIEALRVAKKNTLFGKRGVLLLAIKLCKLVLIKQNRECPCGAIIYAWSSLFLPPPTAVFSKTNEIFMKILNIRHMHRLPHRSHF